MQSVFIISLEGKILNRKYTLSYINLRLIKNEIYDQRII